MQTSVIQSILGRVSSPRLTEPGPTTEDIGTMVACALRAPDHGRLRPWKYLVVQGQARLQLGELFVEALCHDDPSASDVAQAKVRNKPFRAPLILVAVAKVVTHHKIPVVEQISSTAAAVQNIELAAKELGYGAMWRTGSMAYHPLVKRGLDLDDADEIVGFLYLGTTAGPQKAIPELDINDFVSEWSGE